MKILSVLIEYKIIYLNKPFSYVCDDDTKVGIGCRVYVPFGHQNIVGYVIDVAHTELSIEQLNQKENEKFKYIHRVLDEKSILDDELINLAKHMAKEYVCPLISCLQTILPPSYKPAKSGLNVLKKTTLKYVEVSNADFSRARPDQIELLNLIKNNNGMFLKDLNSTKIKTLEKHGFVTITSREVEEDVTKLYQTNYETIKLNDQQQQAYETIINGSKEVYLLQGITGSGKTEVYLNLVDYYVKNNQTAIVLVPEISLTPMIISRFKQRFSNIAVLHGSLSNKEKQIEYDRIRNQEVQVVIGARSAIFAPLKNIGIIILDEEQSTSYKQDNSPCYHARDVAIYRAHNLQAKVVLGSATPSFETKARAMKGLYQIVYLTKRANNQQLPHIDIVNMREDCSDFSPLISKTLDRKINETLDKNEKIILLQNRRGYSPYVSCRSCGYIFKCGHCELSMSYHKKGNMLKCHYCNNQIKFDNTCPKCGSHDFLFMGSGTQKIEEVIENNYPKAKLLRMDNDTTSIKDGHLKILEKFRNEDYNILLGTQMVAKGLDFHDVTLVGVINADISLAVADFRSSEFTFELLSQVSGRAGRGDKTGSVIIQTYNPTHPAILMAAANDYDLFYKSDMLFRKKLSYPPFSYMSSITVLCERTDFALILADHIAERLKKEKEFEILGPAFPYVFKELDKIRVKILIKSKNHELINNVLNEIFTKFADEAKERKCGIKFDIDTYQLL